MRLFLVLACLFAAVTSSVVAQEAERDYTLEEYVAALRQFANRSFFGSKDTNATALINLATMDRTLAKSSAVRAHTISVLKKIDEQSAIERKTAREKEARASKLSSLTGGASNSRQFQRMVKLEQEQRDAQKAEADQRMAMGASIAAIVDQIAALSNTPEGQQFVMLAASPFLEGIDPRSKRQPRIIKGNTRFEVVSTTPEGFFGYEMKVDKTTEAVDGKPAGWPKQDADGNNIYVADSTKNVFVRGYTKSVRMGDVLRIKVTPGEVKEMNGVKLQEYIFVAE